MRAMRLRRPGTPLSAEEIAPPRPGPGRVAVTVAACGVCRTDLHVVDGELPRPKLPLVPQAGVRTHVETMPLAPANEALARLREGRLTGAAVLIP